MVALLWFEGRRKRQRVQHHGRRQDEERRNQEVEKTSAAGSGAALSSEAFAKWRHHRFGPFVPKIAVILNDARIDFDVPVRHVDISNLLYLPEIEFAIAPVQSKDVGRKIVLQIRFQRWMTLR